MLKGVPRWHRRTLSSFLIVLLLSFSLACGLTQGLDFDFNQDEPAPTVDLDSGSGSSDEDTRVGPKGGLDLSAA